MTNEQHDMLLKAINEMNEIRDFEDVEEALGTFTYKEILKMYFWYYGDEMGFEHLFEMFEEFYNMIPKTLKTVLSAAREKS